MERLTLFPSIHMEFTCQWNYIPFLRSLWAILEITSGTAASETIIAAYFDSLPQALDLVRYRLCKLLNGSQPVARLADMVWDDAEQTVIREFLQLKSSGIPQGKRSARESLTLMLSVQNAGLMSALWSILESSNPDHLVNLEIASLPRAVVVIQTTLDQLLQPAINQLSCLDHIVRKGIGIEIVDRWTLFQKQQISQFIGWDLPTLAYKSTIRLN